MTEEPPIDYRTAFERAPIGLVLSRERLIVDCNAQMLAIFGTTRAELLGRSFEVLYPSPEAYERTGSRIEARLGPDGRYADERVMRRLAGERSGELFWCRVSGRALQPSRPHAAGIWTFEDLAARPALTVALTGRERDIATLLIEGLTSKEVGRRLGISHRTVDVYRSRLLKKHGAANGAELVKLLLESPAGAGPAAG